MALKRTSGTRRFEQYALLVIRRMPDTDWEWSLSSLVILETGISPMMHEGGNSGDWAGSVMRSGKLTQVWQY